MAFNFVLIYLLAWVINLNIAPCAKINKTRNIFFQRKQIYLFFLVKRLKKNQIRGEIPKIKFFSKKN